MRRTRHVHKPARGHAGSRPMDFNSTLVIEELMLDGAAYTIYWQSESGRVYRCMGTTNILDIFVQIGRTLRRRHRSIPSISKFNLKLFSIALEK